MGRKLKPRIQLHQRPTQDYQIESIDLEAQGIARQDGKVTFVRGAITGETVRAAVVRIKPSFEVAQTVAVLKESSARVQPRCAVFGICGGCSMQHIHPTAQLAIKQRALEDGLWHLAKLKPEQILPPLAGPDWAYRYRARLSVRNVPKKGGVLVGFHERGTSYVVDMQDCHVLPPPIAKLLMPLRQLIGALSIFDRLPQIELAIGETDTIMLLRILAPLTDADHDLLAAFEAAHNINFWLQSKVQNRQFPSQ